MKTLMYIIFFILGTVLGSFYNVVGFRLSNNGSLIKPKNSYCPSCHHKLSYKDLVPILSYVFLKGKCRYCKNKISIFYPVIELFTGILFTVCYHSFNISYDLIIVLTLVSLFSIIIVSDLNFYIIPDEVTITAGIIILITNALKYGFVPSLTYVLYGIICFLFMYLIGLLGNVLFKQEALGGGDIKLLFVLGLTLPLIESFLGIVLATVLALPISLFLLLKHKDKIIPFGPFLVAAYLMLFLLKLDVNVIYEFFIMPI